MAAIARYEGLAARYVSRLLRCAFLAPDIIESLLVGSAPPEMTLAKVLEGVPLDWAEQRQRFGFSSIKIPRISGVLPRLLRPIDHSPSPPWTLCSGAQSSDDGTALQHGPVGWAQ
jgi:hypothetical protein